MGNYNFENFEASADVIAMSAKDFKALMKKRYGYSAKKAGALHKYLKGEDIPLSDGDDTAISEEVQFSDDHIEPGDDSAE